MPETKPPVRVLLADDHVVVRHGLKLLIDGQPDLKVIAEAGDGASAVDRAKIATCCGWHWARSHLAEFSSFIRASDR